MYFETHKSYKLQILYMKTKSVFKKGIYFKISDEWKKKYQMKRKMINMYVLWPRSCDRLQIMKTYASGCMDVFSRISILYRHINIYAHMYIKEYLFILYPNINSLHCHTWRKSIYHSFSPPSHLLFLPSLIFGGHKYFDLITKDLRTLRSSILLEQVLRMPAI